MTSDQKPMSESLDQFTYTGKDELLQQRYLQRQPSTTGSK